MDSTTRRFTLFDAIAFIGVTAIGFAIVRGFWAANLQSVYVSTGVSVAIGPNKGMTVARTGNLYWPPSAPSVIGGYPLYWCQRVVLWASPLLASWSLGVLVLSFVRPPSLHRQARRPGFVAGVAFLAALVGTLTLSPELLFFFPSGPQGRVLIDPFPWRVQYWLNMPRSAGFAVAVAWLALKAVRRWRPDSGWHDRAGRTLGVCWMTLGLVSLITSWSSLFWF